MEERTWKFAIETERPCSQSNFNSLFSTCNVQCLSSLFAFGTLRITYFPFLINCSSRALILIPFFSAKLITHAHNMCAHIYHTKFAVKSYRAVFSIKLQSDGANTSSFHPTTTPPSYFFIKTNAQTEPSWDQGFPTKISLPVCSDISTMMIMIGVIA